jgi:hypothetical protein
VRPPDAVIIGAQKAATTGLLRTLERHPRVAVPRAAEATALHWGKERWDEWVREQEQGLEDMDAGSLLVAKLASAMYFSETLESIKDMNPAFKVIALLRHPVDRILSQYLYAVQHGLESRPVAVALAEDRVERSGEYRLRTYSEGSRYANAIERIDALFSPDDVLYVDFDTVHTSDGIAVVQRFLGIDDVPLESIRANVSRTPRSAALARADNSQLLRAAGRRIVPARWRGFVRGALQSVNATSKPPAKPSLGEGLRERIAAQHAPDTDAAQKVLAKDLSHWRR